MHSSTRMQVQPKATALTPLTYTSTFDCVKKIYQQFGVAGLHKAQGITSLREWQGYAGYFLTYELLVKNACKSTGKSVHELPIWQIMSFGAAAGYAMWITTFPLDVIKSKLQTDAMEAGPMKKYSGTLDCVRKTYAASGWRGFWKGFAPCMLRAGPVNAATFVAYEFAMSKLGRDY
jgi:solute carrier family 25 carnitine/acylcarnitine transporter 20/29